MCGESKSKLRIAFNIYVESMSIPIGAEEVE